MIEKQKQVILKAYLQFMNNKFLYAKQEEHLLFVEGYSDKVFYYDTFRDEPLIAINEENICINFAYKDEFNKDWISSFGNIYSEKEDAIINISCDAEKIVAQTKGMFSSNFDFVIASTHSQNQPVKNCKINCFGFIDRDFGYKKDLNDTELTFYKPRKLAQTTFHDREATLIFYYFPQLYHSLKVEKSDDDNYYFVEKMGEILYFSTCQGILENYSQKYRSLDMYKVTHENFRDPSKWSEMKKYGDVTSFDFGRYLNELRTVENDKFKIAFLEKCNTDIKNLNKPEFKKEVKEWLENNVHSKLLEDAFLKSNGHILCESIVKVAYKYLGIKSKKEYELINLLIPLIKEYDQDFKDASPVKEYIQYRKDLQNT